MITARKEGKFRMICGSCHRLFDTDPKPELVFGKGFCPHCGKQEATFHRGVQVTVYD